MPVAAVTPAQMEAMQTRFPDRFLMGTAIAGFQNEMGCPSLAPEECEDTQSDWYAFITQKPFTSKSSLHISGNMPTSGPGFYQLYREDLGRTRDELGHNSVRLSLEWSRLFPTASFGIAGFAQLRDIASKEALAYYHDIFATMRQKGLKPLVTINHYTLPLWIHEPLACHKNLSRCEHKGWADPAVMVPEITKFAAFVAEEFGGEVDDWITLNEPLMGVVFPSYLMPTERRSNPPGLTLNVAVAKRASGAMIEAHARMYEAIHRADRWDADGDGRAASVGIVNAFISTRPKTSKAQDQTSADRLNYLLNDMYLEALVRGRYDANWDGKFVERADYKAHLDFIGVNYYFQVQVEKAWLPLLKTISPLLDFDPSNFKLSETHPQGIYEVPSIFTPINFRSSLRKPAPMLPSAKKRPSIGWCKLSPGRDWR